MDQGWEEWGRHVISTLESLVDKQEKQTSILSDNTKSLEHHIKRTDAIEELLKPVHTDYIERMAEEKFIQRIKDKDEQKRKDLMHKLRLPVAIVSALAAIGAAIMWLSEKI